jgi:putative ABC transport system permease protein
VPAGPELWVPGGPGDVPRVAIDEEADVRTNRTAGYLRAVARLKPGVTPAQARAEMASIGDRLSIEHPETGGRSGTFLAVRDQFFGPVERPLFVLAGVVGFVLAIACANVAGLLLGRGAARRRDLAVRRALGATRGRLVRQLLTEATVLSFAGAIAGMLLAWWGASTLAHAAPPDFIGARAIALDARVLGFALLVTIVCGLAFGSVPALQLSRDALSGALGEGGARSSGSRRGGRARDVLVTVEIAVAVVLLVGSVLLLSSFRELTRVDVGLDTRNLLTFEVGLTGERAEYQSKQVQFYQALQEKLSNVPGVVAAGTAVTLPIGGDDFGTVYIVEGHPPVDAASTPHGGYQIVGPGYFAAMRIPIRSGRDVRASDTRQSEPIVLVNEALARQAWPGQDPLGRRLRMDERQPWSRVVGVVGDIRHLGPSVPPRPEIYQADSQNSFPFMAFVVRTSGEPYATVPSLRRAVAELDPNLPLAGLGTMDEHVERALSKPKFFSTLVTAFGLLAVMLALIGIYAMMAWSVTERQREFAIRVALGARGSTLTAMVLRRALVLAAIGIAGGLLGARAATGVLTGLLYGVRPTDPSAFALTGVLVAIVSLAACYVPVRRAIRVDPVSLLR